MKKIILLSFVLAGIINFELHSQSKGDIKKMFYEAESWVLFEDYSEALPKYLDLLKIYPDNYNYKYRIGQCYINIPGEKSKAISYLEEAVKNINPKYKEGKFAETKAPYDSYYYLANAYRINNELDKALATYELFRKDLNADIYDTTIVRLQIESCLNAKEMMKIPVYIKKQNLGNIINDRFDDYNPVISGDQNTLVFNKKMQFQDMIFWSRKVDNEWAAPVMIIPMLEVDDGYVSSLSEDGSELYLYRTDNMDGNIYVSRFINDRWTKATRLNDNINTKYWESHATISHSGKKLFFTSNRKGGYGGLDIYVSDRDSTGEWGVPKNMGPVINTPYNEDTPFLGENDKTLFFSSRGHFNIGGYDIFYSTLLENGDWSAPLNIGFPLNSTDDDLFFDPVNDGYQAYYSMIDSGGYGLKDIYKIEIFSKDHPRKFFVRGIVHVKDLMNIFNDSVKISAFNVGDPNALVIVYSDPLTGEYKFELTQGNYSITYEANGAEKTVKNLEIAVTNPADSFVLPGTLMPKSDFIADLKVESNKTLSVTKGDTIEFPLKVEPRSVLSVEHWLGNSLLTTETFIMDDTSFVYKTVPLTGDNRIVFKLTDRFNNTTTSEIFIKRQKLITHQPVVRPEYKRIIAQKQISAVVGMLNNRADEKLKNVIQNTNFEKQQSEQVDDIISYLKEEAAKSSINPDEIDKLALTVAVRDNVLTQAAFDLLARNSVGDLKNILKGINIYESGLKTWTDLQKFIADKSNGSIQPEELNRIAADILNGVDPFLAKLKEKILAYSENYEKGSLIKQAATITDQNDIKTSSKWLQSVYNQSIKLGLSDSRMANMIVVLSSMPNTDVTQYLDDLATYSDLPFAEFLKKLDLKKLSIDSPEDLIMYLIKNKDAGQYSDNSLFNNLVALIVSKNIPAETIAGQVVKDKEKASSFILILCTGMLCLLFIIFWRKRRKKNKQKESKNL
jgi:hypothetical protein